MDIFLQYLQSAFYITAMGTFIVAVSQFRYNTKWNKKQLTIKMLYELKDGLKIHSKTEKDCDKSETVNISGRKFVYHKNGKDIRLKLGHFLNDLEAFSTAVNDGTFDEKQSKRLMRGIIIRAYKYFQPYVLHLRKDHAEVSQSAYKEN